MTETLPGINYAPGGGQLRRFFHSQAFFRCLIGPFGSGKSVAACIEIFRRACQQKPGPDGVRRTKWLCTRNSYPELKTTTIPTWRAWFPDSFGKFNWGPPPTHRIVQALDDGTVLALEVVFLALDEPDFEGQLKGLEITGAWLNEVRELPQGVIKFTLGRLGRFPSTKDGGPTWYGAIADTNPPDQDHWLYKTTEEDTPEGWAFFKQPGGVIRNGDKWVENPNAENLSHLPKRYYLNQLAGQTDDWIRVFLGGEYGFVQEGKPVYPEFRDSVHVANYPLPPIEGLSLFVGLDFGLMPAAVFGQRTARGQWHIVDEFCAEDMGVVRFSEQLAARLSEWYDGFDVQAWGDPAGDTRAQTDERTCLEIVRNYASIEAKAAPTNDPTMRREAVAGTLNRMVDGDPGLLISPACKILRKGFNGGYRYKRLQVSGDGRYQDKPDKNVCSHPHDALQYLLCGAGEARAIMRKHQRRSLSRPTKTDSAYDVMRW